MESPARPRGRPEEGPEQEQAEGQRARQNRQEEKEPGEPSRKRSGTEDQAQGKEPGRRPGDRLRLTVQPENPYGSITVLYVVQQGLGAVPAGQPSCAAGAGGLGNFM